MRNKVLRIIMYSQTAYVAIFTATLTHEARTSIFCCSTLVLKREIIYCQNVHYDERRFFRQRRSRDWILYRRSERHQATRQLQIRAATPPTCVAHGRIVHRGVAKCSRAAHREARRRQPRDASPTQRSLSSCCERERA